MEKARWQRLENLFEQALDREPAERKGFLEEECDGDRALLQEIEELLKHHGAAREEDFLAHPVEAAQSLRAGEEEQDPLIGRNIGPYRIQRRQGGGGMGDVYLAVREAEFHQQVAIKLLRRSMTTEELLRRFSAEMQVLAVLSKNENIAALLDAGSTEDGLPYFVMEFVDGEPIDAYCDHHRHSLAERIALFRKVCEAVHFAHKHMVIHRDLKIGNIMVRVDGVPKLIDFGIAKLISPELSGTPAVATIAARRFMTADYASPEQARGESLTTTSDVYSLGVVLYELLTGRRPYDLGTLSPDAQVQQICETDPPPPSTALDRDPSRPEEPDPARLALLRGTTEKKLRGQLAGDLDAIVLKALRKEPQRRYATAQELSDDLARFLDGLPVEARPVGRARQSYRWCRRNPAPAALMLTVVLTLIGGVWHLDRLSDQLVRAAAIEGAAFEAETLSAVQDFYAETVVDEVMDRVAVTHRYAVIDGAIPVPASFTIDLGEHIRKQKKTGMFARLYSDHPFKHRDDGGPQDDFESSALERLGQDPSQPYYRFETFEGRPSLRYATARVMQEACVECHNSHLDSPKKDWAVGELRGVLEIIRPLDLDIARVQDRLRETLAYMLGLSLLLLALAALLVRGSRKS